MAGFNLTTAKSASGATPRNPAEASGVPPATPAPVGIGDWNKGEWIAAFKCRVEIGLGIETAVRKLRRRRSRPVRLIPDGENPALSVGMQKCGVAVINAGVQKTEDYIFACISAAVEILRLDNPGDFQ